MVIVNHAKPIVSTEGRTSASCKELGTGFDYDLISNIKICSKKFREMITELFQETKNRSIPSTRTNLGDNPLRG